LPDSSDAQGRPPPLLNGNNESGGSRPGCFHEAVDEIEAGDINDGRTRAINNCLTNILGGGKDAEGAIEEGISAMLRKLLKCLSVLAVGVLGLGISVPPASAVSCGAQYSLITRTYSGSTFQKHSHWLNGQFGSPKVSYMTAYTKDVPWGGSSGSNPGGSPNGSWRCA
jgi:hypothetical protein